MRQGRILNPGRECAHFPGKSGFFHHTIVFISLEVEPGSYCNCLLLSGGAFLPGGKGGGCQDLVGWDKVQAILKEVLRSPDGLEVDTAHMPLGKNPHLHGNQNFRVGYLFRFVGCLIIQVRLTREGGLGDKLDADPAAQLRKAVLLSPEGSKDKVYQEQICLRIPIPYLLIIESPRDRATSGESREMNHIHSENPDGMEPNEDVADLDRPPHSI